MNGTITIGEDEYNDLVRDSKWLCYLEAAGVDNWDGYEFARDAANEDGLFEDEDV